MDEKSPEQQGTGLQDVFRILTRVPEERLVSLTFQLGETPEEVIVHALCLILLQKGTQALNKLQTLKDSYLANHLAEKWRTSKKLEDFQVICGHFQEFTVKLLAELARIFKVLSEQRLCEPLLRNLAYQRALSIDNDKTNDGTHLEYTSTDELREEAKVVCGPQFAEWMSSFKELRLGSDHDPHSGLNNGNSALKLSASQDQSESAHSLPSSLQASSSIASYPTHLEISLASTTTCQEDKSGPATSGQTHPCSALPLVSESVIKNDSGRSNSSKESILSTEQRHSKMDTCGRTTLPAESRRLESSEPILFKEGRESKTGSQGPAGLAAEYRRLDRHVAQNVQDQTAVKTTELKSAAPTAANTCLPKINDPKEMHEREGTEEEEEATFYSFVILHAQEDAEMAERMREKLESIIGAEGATFSGDFEIPGKRTLMCVEDAINNSAFTILLLTRNFHTRLLEVETDSALINSINKKHKYNTVIPLLPQENCMSRHSMPIILQTVVPLVENKTFDKRIKKALSPKAIESQRKVWAEEQKVKEQIRRQERLKLQNKNDEQFIREMRKVKMLEHERQRLFLQQLNVRGSPNIPGFPYSCMGPESPQQVGEDGRVWWPQSNIHIENAKYIMIGNDSQMTVELGGVVDKDGIVYNEDS
ncbi:TIR domain-containing adapter molecule 1 [Myripristis murdjan]|uniref:TIR domain containing adaptor molecule 1 n=1 Tax=Myripristis murdjan TaxID=586833 RepID=A0A667WYN6_9TELE|nr:TIR domain-containing adapter molecule 1-like [Myripristis murdjan]